MNFVFKFSNERVNETKETTFERRSARLRHISDTEWQSKYVSEQNVNENKNFKAIKK